MNISKLVAALGAVACVAVPATARAGILVEYSLNGSTYTTICSAASGTSCSGSVTDGGFVVTITSAASNSPGTALDAKLLSSTTDITYTGTTGNLYLRYGDINYTKPTYGSLLSHIGGTVVTGNGANLLSYVSCLDPTNTQNNCPGATYTTAALSPGVTSTGSFSADNSTYVPSTATPYGVSEVVHWTLGNGADVNFSASTNLVSPEPASMTLLGTGLFGLAGFVRRRKRA